MIAIPAELFDELSSGSLEFAKRICPVTVAPAVFQGISSVVVAPAARLGTVPVATTGTAHPSLNSTLNGVVTPCSVANRPVRFALISPIWL